MLSGIRFLAALLMYLDMQRVCIWYTALLGAMRGDSSVDFRAFMLILLAKGEEKVDQILILQLMADPRAG